MEGRDGSGWCWEPRSGHLGEVVLTASVSWGEFRGPRESAELFSARLGLQAPLLPSINQKLRVALSGSLPSQPDAHGSAGWELPRSSCRYLTHRKLLFMNSVRRQSRRSHCLVTTDILVRCSLRSAQASLGPPGTSARRAPGCRPLAPAERVSRRDSTGDRDTDGGGRGALKGPALLPAASSELWLPLL